MKLEIENNYNEGIRKDNTGHYVFDYETDLTTDLISLTNDQTGVKTVGDLTYYFGFRFNDGIPGPEKTEFRKAIKHGMENGRLFYNEAVFDFAEDALIRLNQLKCLNDFSMVFSTSKTYREKSLVGTMCRLLWEYVEPNVGTYDKFHLELFKKHCRDVTFDEKRADEALAKTNKYSDAKKRAEAIEHLKDIFKDAIADDIRANDDTKGLFTMKMYMPVVGRTGFIDFLKFRNEEDQKLYEELRGSDEVLICDDFLTTGSTINEMKRLLKSINPDVKISVYVLVDQQTNL